MKVEIDGVNYVPESRVFPAIKCGDVFKNDNNDKFILTMPETCQACLISLNDGNRWCEPVQIEDASKISSAEWEEITANQSFKFIRVEK